MSCTKRNGCSGGNLFQPLAYARDVAVSSESFYPDASSRTGRDQPCNRNLAGKGKYKILSILGTSGNTNE